jgi:hypothetical protein
VRGCERDGAQHELARRLPDAIVLADRLGVEAARRALMHSK